MAAKAVAAPTDPRERTAAIDALRGAALLGIAIVNVPWIGMPTPLMTLLYDDAQRARLPALDVAAAGFVEALCEGRFYPIFSALFGFGTGLLLERSKAAYARRILALFVFGVLHATFGWYGDVLLNYAAVGVALALFARLPVRALVGVVALTLAATELASLRFDDWIAPSDAGESAEWAAESVRTYRDGTFLSITQHRLEELAGYFTLPWNVSYRFNVLAMATIGLAVEKSGVHRRLAELRPRIGRLSIALGAAGLVTLAIAVPLGAVQQTYLLASDAIAFGYALAFVWLATAPGARWIAPFAAVGRMALTCYLLQTVCFTLFFYGYGLAMYGALGPAAALALAALVYAGEAVLATLWMRVFQHGPVEWLWRTLTYLRPPRMRIRGSAARSA